MHDCMAPLPACSGHATGSRVSSPKRSPQPTRTWSNQGSSLPLTPSPPPGSKPSLGCVVVLGVCVRVVPVQACRSLSLRVLAGDCHAPPFPRPPSLCRAFAFGLADGSPLSLLRRTLVGSRHLGHPAAHNPGALHSVGAQKVCRGGRSGLCVRGGCFGPLSRQLCRRLFSDARPRFDEQFCLGIKQLLHNYPEDYTTTEGARFWSPPKVRSSVDVYVCVGGGGGGVCLCLGEDGVSHTCVQGANGAPSLSDVPHPSAANACGTGV